MTTSILVFLLYFLVPAFLLSWEFEVPSYGYSLDLPDGWMVATGVAVGQRRVFVLDNFFHFGIGSFGHGCRVVHLSLLGTKRR